MAIRPNKSVDNLPWSPWKPQICTFLLLMFCATIPRGGCSCNRLHKNGSTLAFANLAFVKQHVISQGYQTISCKAFNFCHIQWWYRHTDSDPKDAYPWDLGIFTDVSLEDDNQTLRFQSAAKAAQGSYTCIVSNGTHEINRTTVLKVDEVFWSAPPLKLQNRHCHNQTAEPGQNVSYFCHFYVGSQVGQTSVYWQRPNTTRPEESWSSCGWGTDWLGVSEVREISRYTDYHESLVLRDAKHVSNFGNETPSVGSSLDFFNVSEEAYGLYCVIANNDGLWSRVVLMLSPPDEEPHRPHYRKLTGMVVAAIFILVALSPLIWKIMALDVKLWYQSHFGNDEQTDGLLYDAYISYSWTDDDRQFVLSVIMPYLESFGYRLFIPEIHTVPSNVLLEELSKAMDSSRRCIMLITPSYTTSEFGKYEVDLAADVMSSKLSERIIPVFLGVSPCADPSPLYSSEPSLSSASSSSSAPSSLTSSSQPSSLSSESQTDVSFPSFSEMSQDNLSSIVSACSSDSSSTSVYLSSKPVKINFNFSPLLGQLLKVLKPLQIKRKKPVELGNYKRFLKRLRLRMPKPPGGNMNPMHQEMENVPHTGNLIDNEVLPAGSEVDEGFRMQEFPRLYPVVPNTDVQIAGIPMTVYTVGASADPTSAPSFIWNSRKAH